MAFTPPTGGHFKAPSTAQTYHHDHASLMGHAAASRLATAKALSSGVQPVAPVQPVQPVVPMGAPPAGGNYKAHIAHAVGQHGVHVSMAHVHNAIGSLVAKGQLDPTHGAALTGHNGPITGPHADSLMSAIQTELMTNPKVRQ